MTAETIAEANAELRFKSPLEIVRWAIAQSDGRAIVSTNFRPYEAVILHLVTQVRPEIPVLWVDHGYNRPATYQHAELLKKMLKLNLQPFLPKYTAAHYDAVFGGIPEPTPENEDRLKAFSAAMKLEPFQRGMRQLAPVTWLTALRKVQNPNRAGLEIVSEDKNFNTLKVSPLFHWSDADMEKYLGEHNLPNEWDYFDPAKADEKRECGLHASWGLQAMGSGI
ncbi:MAG TPA: phosphoadenosine phosphosulfate reductase family protein [Candidatus Acidoferrales bacterium]|nr:phosphoadenosine phosphosulfate reductase family protein [Candidatus Acidoferrales bacterium]